MTTLRGTINLVASGVRPSRKIKANSSSYSRGETREDDGTATGVDGDYASDGCKIGKRRERMERGMTALNTSGAMMTDHAPTEPSDDDDCRGG
jgi:hypothetical protein